MGVEPGRDGHPGPYAFPVVPDALYDLENDIAETKDVAANNPGVVTRLDALAEEARRALGDRLNARVGEEVRGPGRGSFDRPEEVAHAGVGAALTLASSANPSYPGHGPSTLVDGRVGSRDHHDPMWLGFSGDDVDATIDLGKTRNVTRMGLDCLQAQEPWIFFPRSVVFSASEDGERWREVGRVDIPVERNPERAVRMIEVEVGGETEGVSTRYLRVVARNQKLPSWHPGTGENAWIFADEIVVEAD